MPLFSQTRNGQRTSLLSSLRAYFRMVAEAVGRGPLFVALLITIGASLTEGLGLALVLPLLNMVDSAGSAANGVTAKLAMLFEAIGLNLTFITALTAFVLALSLRAVLARGRTLATMRIRGRFVSWLRLRLYRAIACARWSAFSQARQSDLIVTLSTEMERIAQGTYLCLQLPTTAAVSAVNLFIAFRLAPSVTLAVLIGASLAFFAMRAFVSETFRLSTEATQANRRMISRVTEFLAAVKLAKSYGVEDRHIETFAAAEAELRENSLAQMRRGATRQLILQIGSAVALGAMAYLAVEIAQLRGPELILLVAVFSRTIPLLLEIQRSSEAIVTMLGPFSVVAEAIDRFESAREEGIDDVGPLMSLASEIRFDRVTFRHGLADGPTPLHEIDLVIPSRQITAIVGPSGAGKTTIADLILGLLVPVEGRITVDGVPLDGKSISRWRRGVAYVPQEPFLFHDTIRANLTWAKPDASDEEMLEALRMAGATDLVTALPEALDTMVGDRGSRFSGGERQRLALARALLRHPSLLILDEATSALDAESERLVVEALDKLRGKITILVIAHRQSIVDHADRVLKLGRGRVTVVRDCLLRAPSPDPLAAS